MALIQIHKNFVTTLKDFDAEEDKKAFIAKAMSVAPEEQSAVMSTYHYNKDRILIEEYYKDREGEITGYLSVPAEFRPKGGMPFFSKVLIPFIGKDRNKIIYKRGDSVSKGSLAIAECNKFFIKEYKKIDGENYTIEADLAAGGQQLLKSDEDLAANFKGRS